VANFVVKTFLPQSEKMAREPIDQYLIDIIRQKRKAFGMTQDDLADELGVSKGLIGMVESTKYYHVYSASQLNQLAKIFKCSPKDFWPERPL
jgi:transcriptional regulator with XRE-family HTH domain